MNDGENTTKEGEHYVCYGGCHGVSPVPGTCQAEDCADHGKPLHACNCGDGEHHNFQGEE